MSDRTIRLAEKTDEAQRQVTELRCVWQGAAGACAVIRAAAPGKMAAWLADELQAIEETAWRAYQDAAKASHEIMMTYLAACKEERPALEREAAARAARS